MRCGRAGGHAGAERDDQAGARFLEVLLVDQRQERCGTLEGCIEVDIGQHDRELVATEAYREITRTDAALQRPRDADEHGIAGQVTVTVVHLLEGVDVEQDEGDAGDVEAFQLRQVLLERPAVADAGQIVEASVLAQELALGRQPLGLDA